MKTQTLDRLGALAMVAGAIAALIISLNYFIGGMAAATTVQIGWLDMAGDVFLAFSAFALYAALRERGGVLAFAGFVLVVVSMVVGAGQAGQTIAVASGMLVRTQADPGVSSTLFDILGRYAYVAGLLLMGYAITRSRVFPAWTGVLLVLAGATNLLTGFDTLLQYLFVAVSTLAWLSLGWALWNRSPRAGGARPIELASMRVGSA
jgi:hypothetical protein